MWELVSVGLPTMPVPGGLLEQSVDPVIFRQSGRLAFAFRHLSEGYLLADRPDDALTVGVRGLEYPRGRKDKGTEAWIVHLLGEVASHDSRLDASSAEEHYRQCLSLATELGMRPLVAHCHLGLGELFRRTDKREQAREHHATATTMYRDMGMTYWLDRRRRKCGR